MKTAAKCTLLVLSIALIITGIILLTALLSNPDGVLGWMAAPVQEFFTESQADENPSTAENPILPKTGDCPAPTPPPVAARNYTVDSEGRIINHRNLGLFPLFDPNPTPVPVVLVDVLSYGHNILRLSYNDGTKEEIILSELDGYEEFAYTFYPQRTVDEFLHDIHAYTLIQEEIMRPTVYWLDILGGDLFIRTGGEAERLSLEEAKEKYAEDEELSALISDLLKTAPPPPPRTRNPEDPSEGPPPQPLSWPS